MDRARDATTWSPQMYVIYGRDPKLGAISHADALEYVHPSDRQQFVVELEGLFDAGEEFEYEFRIIAGDGVQRDVRIVGRADAHHPTRFIGTLQDLTEQRRVEQATAHLAAIVECSDDAIIGKTLHGRVTSWNPGAERIYGFTAAEMIGRSIAVLAPSRRERKEIDRLLARLRRGESVDHFETQRRRKDGRWIAVSLTISPIRDGSGAIVGASSVARDITEHKRTADALLYAEERFRSAFEHAPIGMALLDLNLRIASVNAAMCRLTGHDFSNLEDANLRDLLLPSDRPSLAQTLAILRSGDQSLHESTARIKHARGHPVAIALQLTLIRAANGGPLRYIAQAQDLAQAARPSRAHARATLSRSPATPRAARSRKPQRREGLRVPRRPQRLRLRQRLRVLSARIRVWRAGAAPRGVRTSCDT